MDKDMGYSLAQQRREARLRDLEDWDAQLHRDLDEMERLAKEAREEEDKDHGCKEDNHWFGRE